MELKNYHKKILAILKALVLVFFMSNLSSASLIAQTKILPNEVTYTSGNKPRLPLAPTIPTVDDPTYALNDNDNEYARLYASPGIVAGLGAYKGVIELKFDQTLPADTWSYVEIETSSDILKALLGGSLGNLLGDVLGTVLIGNQELTFDARLGASSVLSRSSTQGFGTERVRLIEDGEGVLYLAMRPNAQYDRIRITNDIGSLLGLGNEVTLDVYNAFYFDEATDDECGRPFATSFDGGGGIGLEIGDIANQNLGNAIDEDLDSFSTLKSTSILNINVASTLSQYFYFATESSETTTLNLKIALGSGGLVNTDLLGAIEIVLYDADSNIIYKRSLQSSLLNNTDALNLLDSGAPATLTFAPGRKFQKAQIKLNSPIGLQLLGDGVKIYDVQRYDGTPSCPNPEIAAVPTPTDNPFEVPSCAASLLDFANVDFPHQSVDGNNETYTTILADSGTLLVSGPTAGFIEMDMGQTLSANQTTYVRIGYDEDVLDRLLGGSLGKLISDLGDGLLLGNQFIQVEALDNNGVILNENSSNVFDGTADGLVSVVEDNIGRYYLSITPFSDYNSIRITNHVTAVLPTGKKASLDVYNACFELGEDNCFPANFTSYRGSGVNLSLGDLSEVGVTDPYKAISANSSEYSTINLGIAGLAAGVYQSVYFSNASASGDHVKIRLMIEPSSALSLDLLGAYKIKFFNGSTQVGSDYDLQSGLLNNIDLLALFSSGGSVTLDFEPEGTFDRVDIGAESLVQLNVAAEPLRVYEVSRYGTECPLAITPSPFDVSSCATDLVDAQNADEVQNLFDDDFDSYATLKSGAGTLLGINKFEGFVEMKYNTLMPAGTTSYIRIDFDEDILKALVSGSLGNIVTNLLDGLALGDHYFEVDVKNDATTVLSGSSKNADAGGNDQIRIVQDALGRYYIAVTPDQEYNAVRITDMTDSALGLLVEPNTMNVYGMCTELSEDSCLDAFATSYEYSGINLSISDLSGAGVTNMEYALDENTQHYSEISNGTLGIGASTKQWIFFNTISSPESVSLIKFKTQGGAVDIDLLGGLEIKAYLGNVEVAQLDFQNGIVNGINVLDLINNNQLIELPFKPGSEYDRISVGIKTLVEASIFPPVQLYGVERCAEIALACLEIFPGGEWDQLFTKAQVDQLPDPIIDTYDPITVAGTNAGLFFDIYRLDNSFNLKVNGQAIANQEIQFDSGTPAAPTNNVRFLDGDLYRYDVPPIWKIMGTADKPMLRVEVSPTGEVTLYGSKVSGGQLYELVLYNGAQFNTVTWNEASDNTIEVTQDANGGTILHGKVYGESICATGLFEITKTGSFDNTTPAQVGNMIIYTIKVENVSDEDITDVVVVDPLLGGELSGYVESGTNDNILNIGETWTYMAEYPITSEDIANEGVYNQATVFGKDSNGNAIPTKKSYDPDGLEPGDPGYDPDCATCTFTPLTGTDSCVVRHPVDSEDPFYWAVTGPHRERISNEGTVMGTNGSFIFDIYHLDNSFNLTINGTDIATQEIEFWQSPLNSINVQFMDGDKYMIDTPNIKSIRGDQENPMLRVIVSVDGEVRLFGSKESYGQLYELEPINGNSFNTINWHENQENDLVVSQNIYYTTILEGYGYGIQNNCENYTLEKTGAFNDENSDGKAQVGETVTYTFAMQNTGDIALFDPVIYDVVLGGYVPTDSPTGDTNGNGILDVAETWIFNAGYAITEEDIAKGGVYNQAEMTANDASGLPLAAVLSVDPESSSLDPERPDHTFVSLTGEDCISFIQDQYIEYTTSGYNANQTTDIVVDAGNGGYVIDIYQLDNSFNLKINNTQVFDREVQFWKSALTIPNVEFADGSTYQSGVPNIKSLQGDQEHPIVRITISKDGVVSLEASRESFGELYPLTLINNEPNPAPWISNEENIIVFSQELRWGTSVKMQGSIVQDQCAGDYIPMARELETDLENSKLTFYPNPVNATLYVQANTLIEEIEIYNLLGQRVVNLKPNNNETKINVEYLQANVYMMKVTLNGKVETYRVIKE